MSDTGSSGDDAEVDDEFYDASDKSFEEPVRDFILQDLLEVWAKLRLDLDPKCVRGHCCMYYAKVNNYTIACRSYRLSE